MAQKAPRVVDEMNARAGLGVDNTKEQYERPIQIGACFS